MTSTSDAESNVSSFICYNNKNYNQHYTCMVQNLELIHQDILEIERNMKNIIQNAGPLESQLNALLKSLPKPNIILPMETD
ncbi:unnamed protein product [Leptosia nina]|uniref:Uncharacterized protein n=1 Tax=Leptosia nina TaxID=320188 RepID=A0AAV1J9F0_9NEOP